MKKGHVIMPASRFVRQSLRCFTIACMGIAGCTSQQTPVIKQEPEIAIWLNESETQVLLDTRIAPPQYRSIGLGQGSITLETLAVDNGLLTIHYQPEIEGEYHVYECQIPISGQPIVFEIDPSGDPGETPFDLKDCRLIRKGNLHFE